MVIGIVKKCPEQIGKITPGLNNDVDNPETNIANPYVYLENTIGNNLKKDLYRTNDSDSGNNNYKGRYTNVIPLIEKLPVQE